ncbi:MAG: TRAP transporter substrate-binding protein [Castellaniella sp.]|uniref:TRAP transporter substrate-binding protein n=1 Tax=Castellaniella sp. TaxID=1955812 RepID=UPI003C77FAB1
MRVRIAGLAFACVAGLASTSAFAAKAIVLRVAHAMPESHSYQKWVEGFRTELDKLAPGRIEVKAFPSAQLGTETEYLEGMKLGTLDGAVVGRHGQIDPRLDVLNLPMIFRDEAHKDAVMRSGSALNQQLDQIMYDKGYKVLGWGELGFRDITTRDKPLRKASDLAGIDIRVPNVAPWLYAFKQWGANPTPMDFSEVYSALQQGVINAQENPPEIIYTSKFYEVQKYMNLTHHASIPCEFVVSRRFWEKLPGDLQTAVMQAATVSRDAQVRLSRESNAGLISQLRDKGMTIVDDVDRDSFREGAQKTYAQYGDVIGTALIQAVVDAGKP